MWYRIDYKILTTALLPTFLRKTVQLRWLWSLLVPVEQLHEKWKLQREQNLYRLAHNGQICHLRKVLNDQFDPSQRRIYINDGLRYKRQYIYTHAEQRPKNMYTQAEQGAPYYLRPASDYADTGVDFVVWIPEGLVYNEFDLKGWIDTYKLASKRYKIERYE